MLSNNPFLILSETISPFAMQSFIIAMVLLIAVGTIIQMIHHKNLTYFFNNAKKAKLSATKELGVGEKVSVIAKTTVVDIGTTSELGFGKRRLASLLLPKPNSEVVPISTTVVLAITETFSPTPSSFVADSFAFFALLKK